jgi:hypothetical protein
MLARLIVGDTLNFATTVAGYSAADGWALKYVLVPLVSGASITLTTAADGSDHRLQVGAVTTATWPAGSYNWASWVEKASEKYSVSNGQITLLADPRTATAPFDLRTDAQIALVQARAAFQAWTPTTRRYSIDGREMEFASAGDIIKVVRFWETEVAREDNAALQAKGMASRRKVYVRLVRG